MSTKVKAMVLEGARKIVPHQFDRPAIGPDDALLKVEMCGVCGSDVSMYNDKYIIPYPVILGHEILGYIEEIGERAAERRNLRQGDRVVVEYSFGCGHCEACIQGEYNSCSEGLTYGSKISSNHPPHLWGAYAEYLYLPPRAMVHKISEAVPAKAAVLTCAILGNGVRWLRTIGQVTLGDTVVILGPGQQGLAGVIAAKEAGAGKIIIVGKGERDRVRLDMAMRLGADFVIDTEQEDAYKEIKEVTQGRLADVVMDVTSKPAGLAAAVKMVRSRGVIVAPGLYGAKTEVPLVMDTLIRKEASIKGVFSHDYRAVEQALQIVESGRYPLEDLVTHVFNLEEADLALKVAGGEVAGEYPIKTVLVP